MVLTAENGDQISRVYFGVFVIANVTWQNTQAPVQGAKFLALHWAVLVSRQLILRRI